MNSGSYIGSAFLKFDEDGEIIDIEESFSIVMAETLSVVDNKGKKKKPKRSLSKKSFKKLVSKSYIIREESKEILKEFKPYINIKKKYLETKLGIISKIKVKDTENKTYSLETVAKSIENIHPGIDMVILSENNVMKKNIPMGIVTKGDIYDSLNTKEELIEVSLIGRDLKSLLERYMYTQLALNNSPYIFSSNFSFRYRIKDQNIKLKKIKFKKDNRYEKIKEESLYRIILNSSWKEFLPRNIRIKEYNEKILNIFIAYCKSEVVIDLENTQNIKMF